MLGTARIASDVPAAEAGAQRDLTASWAQRIAWICDVLDARPADPRRARRVRAAGLRPRRLARASRLSGPGHAERLHMGPAPPRGRTSIPVRAGRAGAAPPRGARTDLGLHRLHGHARSAEPRHESI